MWRAASPMNCRLLAATSIPDAVARWTRRARASLAAASSASDKWYVPASPR